MAKNKWKGGLPRPAEHLIAATKLYPRAWKEAESFLQGKGADLPDWPTWCFLPIAGWLAIASEGQEPKLHTAGNAARLAALGAWRITQGIYRFHPSMYEALSKTSLKGNLPSDILTRLPEWCAYLETPPASIGPNQIFGFFVHLEHDANDGRKELRFLIDSEEALWPIVLHLGDWTVEEAINRFEKESVHVAKLKGLPDFDSLPRPAIVEGFIQPFLSLVLYLCSQAPEYKGGNVPNWPQPKKTKKGVRWFPASHPRIWDIGHTTGEAIEKFRKRKRQDPGVDRARPEPHIRRAHWHGFRTGPRDGVRRFDVRWLPPIPVNVDLVEEGGE